MSAIDFVKDNPTRETLKDMELRLSALEGNIGLVVQNRSLIVQGGNMTVTVSPVEPVVPEDDSAFWFKPLPSGAVVIYIATGTSRGREWLHAHEST